LNGAGAGINQRRTVFFVYCSRFYRRQASLYFRNGLALLRIPFPSRTLL
jgi:hypothetical protein